eukprot:6356629-Pyramimonas_sp.AAC.1
MWEIQGLRKFPGMVMDLDAGDQGSCFDCAAPDIYARPRHWQEQTQVRTKVGIYNDDQVSTHIGPSSARLRLRGGPSRKRTRRQPRSMHGFRTRL